MIGIDLVDVPSFAEQLADGASGFAAATFTEAERRAARGAPERLAGWFAAKEAFIKAWSGARFGQAPQLGPLDLTEIEVVHDGYGRPALRLHGAVAAAVGPVRTTVSLSHDGPAAIAVVLLEAQPQPRLG